MQERIVELEIRYTHQQRMLEELSEVVLEQGRTLGRLTEELAMLRGRLASEPDQAPANDPPPHY